MVFLEVSDVYVGSTSKLKIVAVAVALEELEITYNNILARNVSSDVSDQPINDETATGAWNRLDALLVQHHRESDAEPFNPPDADAPHLFLAIENGLRLLEDGSAVDFVVVVTQYGKVRASTTEDCCVVPRRILQQRGDGESWGQVAARLGLAMDHADPHASPDFGGVSRVLYVKKAIMSTISKLGFGTRQSHSPSAPSGSALNEN